MKNFLLYCFLLLGYFATAQTLEPLYEQRGLSFRGISVVTDSIVWVSGTKGTVGKSLDGGATWSWITVPGFETRDFRDIEAFDDQRAVIIAIDTPAQILYTTDGGLNWKMSFNDPREGMFLDAMDFENEVHGFVIGDPVEGNFFLAETKDGGLSWVDISGAVLSKPDSVEAFFAASGSNILYHNNNLYAISGGLQSFLHINNKKLPLPLMKGSKNTGANGMVLYNNLLYVVGGDFTKPQDSTENLVILHLENQDTINIMLPLNPPKGYRSGIAALQNGHLVTCGMNGVDFSDDGGFKWRSISTVGYHTIMKAKKGNTIYLAGGNGRIAKFKPATP